jgi:hypothetical protein
VVRSSALLVATAEAGPPDVRRPQLHKITASASANAARAEWMFTERQSRSYQSAAAAPR